MWAVRWVAEELQCGGLGNKQNNVDVVYTPWSNLKKTPSMDVGQVLGRARWRLSGEGAHALACPPVRSVSTTASS